MPSRIDALTEALEDVDTTWALTVAAVMLAHERNTVTKAAACKALDVSDADYDIWRRRFASLGHELFRRLNRAAS